MENIQGSTCISGGSNHFQARHFTIHPASLEMIDPSLDKRRYGRHCLTSYRLAASSRTIRLIVDVVDVEAISSLIT